MDRSEANFRAWMAVILLAITGVGVMDMVLDWPHGPSAAHLGIEIVFITLCLLTAVYLGTGWFRTRQFLREAQAAADRDRAERDSWRRRAQELLAGLGQAIDAQLREWELTAAERETAFLLLKGFSHKEIARLGGKSERTVRQHAVSVYRKSGLSGRAELSAFFLEDLLMPVAGDGESGAPADG